MKLKVILLIGLILTGIGLFIYNISEEKIEPTKQLKNVYSGAVPEGYDEEHFRKTGITIKIKE